MILTQKNFQKYILKNVFFYDTETYADEGNCDCEPYGVGFFPDSKISNFIFRRDLTPDEIEKKNFFKGEDCIDKRLHHINKKWRGDTKKHKKKNFH